MKKLSGYVLLKETGSGVPNLVVTAYDSENSISAIRDQFNNNDFRIEGLGKRLGSVLTDQEGRFALSSEDLEFQGNESRPDLLIIVFAPEDPQDIEQPYPLPAEQRILYISAAPVTDAGAEEAFVIRLRQTQLDKFSITTDQSARAGVTQSSRFAGIVESTWTFRDSLKARLSPRLREEQQRAEARRKVAQEQVKDLSAIPLHLRDNKFLIKDKNDLKTNLQQRQADAIAEGLDRLATLEPTLHLALTPSDLSDLGLSQDGGQLTGEVDPVKLAAKVRSLMKSVDLVRVRGLNNPSPDELEQMYLSARTDDTTVAPIN